MGGFSAGIDKVRTRSGLGTAMVKNDGSKNYLLYNIEERSSN